MNLVSLVIWLVILGLIFYLVEWVIGQIPLPQPVRVVIRAILALVLILILLQMLGVVGGPIQLPRLRYGSVSVAEAQGTPTPAQIERPEPSAKPTKNPHAMHHHFDTRHPHKSTRPQVQNPPPD